MVSGSYDSALLFWPDVQDVVQNHLYLSQTSFLIFLVVLIFTVSQLLWKGGATGAWVRSPPLQRFKMLCWVLELLAGVNCVVLLLTMVDGSILYSGTLFPGRRTGDIDDDWDTPPAWLSVLVDFLTFFACGVLPFIVIYFLEFFQMGENKLRAELGVHHFVVFLTVFFGVNAFLSTLNAVWLQTGAIMFLQLALEFPVWVALLCYRLKTPHAEWVMLTSTVFEVLFRLALWFGSTVNYVHLCWTAYNYSMWEVVWRWGYPFVLLIQSYTQVQTLLLHYLLYTKLASARRRKGRDGGVSGEGKGGEAGEGGGEGKGREGEGWELGEVDECPADIGQVQMQEQGQMQVQEQGMEQGQGQEQDQVQVQRQEQEQGLVQGQGKHTYTQLKVSVSSGTCMTQSTSGGELSTSEPPSLYPPSPCPPTPLSRQPRQPRQGQGQKGQEQKGQWRWQEPLVVLCLALNLALFSVAFAHNSLPITDSGQYTEVAPRQRVAIVGGGVAGLGAAWAFKRSNAENEFQVTLFEAHPALGGAAYTYYGEGGYNEHGFAVMRDYFNFELLLEELGVGTDYSTGGFSAVYHNSTNTNSTNSNTTVYSTLGLGDKFFDFYTQIGQLERDLQEAVETMHEEQLMTTTVRQFLQRPGSPYTAEFAHQYLSVCMKSYLHAGAAVLDTPIALLWAVERRFGLCTTPGAVPGRQVRNGSSSYVNALRDRLLDGDGGNRVAIHTNTSITAFKTYNGGLAGRDTVRLRDSEGVWRTYDHVIFAIKRHEISDLLGAADSSHCNLYDATEAAACRSLYGHLYPSKELPVMQSTVMHTDTALVESNLYPLRDADGRWHADQVAYALHSNTTLTFDTPTHEVQQGLFTQNAGFQPPTRSRCHKTLPQPYKITDTKDNVDSLNIPPAQILSQRDYSTPSHDTLFFKRGRSQHVLQGLENVWFAGCEQAVNFHEEAFVTGLVVAQRLGAGYAFSHSALALKRFVTVRAWVLYGLNFILPDTVQRVQRGE